jgi:hypothetical protein
MCYFGFNVIPAYYEEVAVAAPTQLEQLALLLEIVDQDLLVASLSPEIREALASAEGPEDLSEEVIAKVAEAVYGLMETQGAQE